MSFKVAVDWGFGFTKAINELGEKTSFPSIVSSIQKEVGVDLLGTREDYTIEIDSKRAAVGHLALLHEGVRAWESDYVHNHNLTYLLVTAAALLNPASHSIVLGAGLPIAYYRNQKKSVEEMFQGMHCGVRINGGADRRRVDISNVRVFPQAAGVYYSEALNIDGTIKNPEMTNKPVGIIDIGYRTTDLLVMQKGRRGATPRGDLSGGLDRGMNTPMQMIKEELDVEFGDTIPLQWIEQSLLYNNGKLYYCGKERDLNEYKREADKNFVQEICNIVNQKWGQEINRLACVLIAGGGGKELYPLFKEQIPQAKVAEDAFYSNARGFLAAMNLAEKR